MEAERIWGHFTENKEIAGRNMNVKSSSGAGSEGSEEHGGESVCHCREHIHHHEQNVVRNMKIKDALVKNGKIFICLLLCLYLPLEEKRTE